SAPCEATVPERASALGSEARLQGAPLGRAVESARARSQPARGAAPLRAGYEGARRVARAVRGAHGPNRSAPATRARAPRRRAGRARGPGRLPARDGRRGARSAARAARYVPRAGAVRARVDLRPRDGRANGSRPAGADGRGGAAVSGQTALLVVLAFSAFWP